MSSVETKPGPEITEAPAPVPSFLLPKSTYDQSLWKSLSQNLNDFFFPKKQPPLVLTSKPIPVKDIWGFYDNKKSGAFGSSVMHILLLAVIIGGTIWARNWVKKTPPPSNVTTLILDETPLLKPSKTVAGGGGGGGDRDKFQATKGKLPKLAMEQITPPAIVVRNDHPKLTVEPTVVVPPQIKLAMSMPNLGDPTSKLPSGPLSNGTGSGGGIGSGSGGGVGVGSGPGVGEGHGGGIGGGVFRVGGGVSAPRPTYQPDPEYSEEARKAKYQGTSVLSLIVGADGRPSHITVARTLGLGLDEKAIEAVKQWKFEPAMKDGKPVAVEISVEIDFHLY